MYGGCLNKARTIELHYSIAQEIPKLHDALRFMQIQIYGANAKDIEKDDTLTAKGGLKVKTLSHSSYNLIFRLSEVNPMSIGSAYCKTSVLYYKLFVVGSGSRVCGDSNLLRFLICKLGYGGNGEVYDPKTNVWVDMPTGVGEGFPAKQKGTKRSVIVDCDLPAFDPSNSLGSAKIKVYNYQDDTWKVVLGGI
nr:hypothetical protein [Tanacetum cinerariifolium]